ncbi:MAG: alpha-N-arabinofuranosidase, partial [Bacteroidetes bacterium]|nr:alpha-N-arabinofuranosidase [Bacteroidota bacterium]
MPALLIGLLPLTFAHAQQATATLQPAEARSTISKEIYGHFAEHLGHCIYSGFYVGDTSKTIPNTEGVRNDIIAALKKLKVPVLRWPGGCFADTYHWKDGVGPRKDRPTIVNQWWGGVTEDNSFGTHDFLNMCERIGAEPYLAGNVGSGTVQELIQWVQ